VDPIGSHLRTYLASELGELTGSSLRWSRQDLPSRPNRGGFCGGGKGPRSQRVVSLHPTPRAEKGGLPDSHGRRLAVPLPDGSTSQDLATAARAWRTSGRRLLAAIYELMMGFPTGWLISRAAHTAMLSTRSSRSSSPEA
jgi:hypothetical protein